MGQSPEYKRYICSPEWRNRTANYHLKTGGRCVLLPWKAARDTHHLTYRNLEGEAYIRDCVPLSRTAHDWIHHSKIGQWFWLDIKSRRRTMNFAIRIMAIGVTVFARLFGYRKPDKPKLKNKNSTHLIPAAWYVAKAALQKLR